jgi:hypothetical protein
MFKPRGVSLAVVPSRGWRHDGYMEKRICNSELVYKPQSDPYLGDARLRTFAAGVPACIAMSYVTLCTPRIMQPASSSQFHVQPLNEPQLTATHPSRISSHESWYGVYVGSRLPWLSGSSSSHLSHFLTLHYGCILITQLLGTCGSRRDG